LADVYLGDLCRWPELANVNRTIHGTYAGIRTGSAYHIPDHPSAYPPSILTLPGIIAPIPPCEFDAEGRLLSAYPCVYEVPADQPIYGFAYDEVARRFFGDSTLGPCISGANLANGCSASGTSEAGPQLIYLQPGTRIVIPVRPVP
jgi:hypothetical protein